MQLEKEDEMECLVSGCNFLLKAIRHEAFTFEEGQRPISSPPMVCSRLVQEIQLWLLNKAIICATCNQKRCRTACLGWPLTRRPAMRIRRWRPVPVPAGEHRVGRQHA